MEKVPPMINVALVGVVIVRTSVLILILLLLLPPQETVPMMGERLFKFSIKISIPFPPKILTIPVDVPTANNRAAHCVFPPLARPPCHLPVVHIGVQIQQHLFFLALIETINVQN